MATCFYCGGTHYSIACPIRAQNQTTHAIEKMGYQQLSAMDNFVSAQRASSEVVSSGLNRMSDQFTHSLGEVAGAIRELADIFGALSPPPFDCSFDCIRHLSINTHMPPACDPMIRLHHKSESASGKIRTTPTSSLISEYFKSKVQDARRLENMSIAYDYANNFRQDLQDGQDLDVVLWHPVHYVCAPC